MQYSGVFLYHKKEGTPSRVYAEVPGNRPATIAAFATVCDGIRPQFGIYRANTNGTKASPLGLAKRHTLVAQKAFIQPHLGLTSEIVVNTSKDDDNLLAGIGSLTDQTVIVCGLPGLNVPNNEPPPIPRP